MIDFKNMARGTKLIDKDRDEHTFIAYVPEAGPHDCVVTLSGRSSIIGWGEDYFELAKQVRYMNVYPDGVTGMLEESVRDADAAAASHRVARVRVEFAPGQLDD